jgi:AAA+ superfamily predicted ATPase
MVITKHLNDRCILQWFSELHKKGNGIISSKIYMEFMFQEIQHQPDPTQLISNSNLIFGPQNIQTGLQDNIPLILNELNDSDQVFFLAATLKSGIY